MLPVAPVSSNTAATLLSLPVPLQHPTLMTSLAAAYP
jgi:hypothetical protein